MSEPNSTSRDDFRKMSMDDLERYVAEREPDAVRLLAQVHLMTAYANTAIVEKMPALVSDIAEYARGTGTALHLAQMHRSKAIYLYCTRQYKESLEELEQGLKQSQLANDREMEYQIFQSMSGCFYFLQMYDKAVDYCKKVYDHYKEKDGPFHPSHPKNLGVMLIHCKQFEEAIEYLEEALELEGDETTSMYLGTKRQIAIAYADMRQFERAMRTLMEVTDASEKVGSEKDYWESMGNLASLYAQLGDHKKAIEHYLKGAPYFEKVKNDRWLAHIYSQVQDSHAVLGEYKEAYEYLKLTNRINEQLSTAEAKNKAEMLGAQLEMERKEKEFEMRLGQARLQTLTKIASDIAHEVQNPLQFVNNFSALNLELTDELNEYVDANNTDGIKEVAKDITDNCQKVRDYGLRISDVVSRLLEQTRKAQTGELVVDEKNEYDFSDRSA